MNTFEQARDYLARGWSIIPIKANKQPDLSSWAPYMSAPPSAEQVEHWFALPGPGIGIVLGPVSGVGVLDVEDAETWARLLDLLRLEPELGELVERSPVTITPSAAGRHLYCRIAHESQSHSKLASDASGELLAEWRFARKYVVAPGSPGRCHPTGGLYRWERLPADPPTWSAEQVEHLLGLVSSLGAPKQSGEPEASESPGDVYNATGAWAELLEGAGWSLVRDGAIQYWRRPGKSSGISATLGHSRSRRGEALLYVFSSNASPFEGNKSYSLFAARSHLLHGGDFSRCARELSGKPGAASISSATVKLRMGAESRAPAEESDIVSFSRIETREVKWLWEGRIPRGMLTVLEGPPKRGKSLLMIDLAARISRGHPMPDGSSEPEPGRVLIVNPEDPCESVVGPRLIAAGADRDMIFLHRGFALAGKESRRRPVLTDENLTRIEHDILNLGARLVIFDAVMGLFPNRVDTNSDSQARGVLEPLARMAEKLEVALVIGRHWSKGAGARASFERGLGSIAFTGVARSVLQVGTFPGDRSRKVVGVGASNGKDVPVLEFRTEGVSVALDSGAMAEVPRIEWVGPCDLDVEDIDRREPSSANDAENNQNRCESFVMSRLTELEGAIDSSRLEKEARQAGFHLSTLKRAKLAMRDAGLIRSSREGDSWRVHLRDFAAIEKAHAIFED